MPSVNNSGTLPLEILGHTGLQQDLHQLATADDVLGNQIDIPVTVLAELRWRILAWSEQLPQVREVKGSTFPTVEGISVDMQHLLA
jgi:hypothetical protein